MRTLIVFKNRGRIASVLWIERELSRLEVENDPVKDPNR